MIGDEVEMKDGSRGKIKNIFYQLENSTERVPFENVLFTTSATQFGDIRVGLWDFAILDGYKYPVTDIQVKVNGQFIGIGKCHVFRDATWAKFKDTQYFLLAKAEQATKEYNEFINKIKDK